MGLGKLVTCIFMCAVFCMHDTENIGKTATKGTTGRQDDTK